MASMPAQTPHLTSSAGRCPGPFPLQNTVEVNRDGTLLETRVDHVFNQEATQADVYERASGEGPPNARGDPGSGRHGSCTVPAANPVSSLA